MPSFAFGPDDTIPEDFWNAPVSAPVLEQDRAAVIQDLRRQAAAALGYGRQVPTGSATEYRGLPASAQVALTDKMAEMIATNPIYFTDEEQEIAQARIDSIYYQEPLADTSYKAALMEAISDGSFFNEMTGGAKDYSNKLLWYGAGALVILVAVSAAFNRRN